MLGPAGAGFALGSDLSRVGREQKEFPTLFRAQPFEKSQFVVRNGRKRKDF